MSRRYVTIDDIIEDLVSKPLSGEEMIEACQGETNVITHQELANVEDIYDLFGDNDNFIMLYETEPNYGHWVCVINHPEENTIEFFDPYGKKIDSQLSYISDPSIDDYPHLSELLLASGAKIIHNDQPLQKHSKDISSCGRHCILRVNMRDIPLDQYQAMLMSKKPSERDKIVTMLTSYAN